MYQESGDHHPNYRYPQLLVARDTMSTSESDFPGSLKESINAELSLRSYDD